MTALSSQLPKLRTSFANLLVLKLPKLFKFRE